MEGWRFAPPFFPTFFGEVTVPVETAPFEHLTR